MCMYLLGGTHMSIKIYNGYRLPKMTVKELNQFILKVQQGVENIQKEMIANALAQIITNDLDDLIILGKEKFIENAKESEMVEEIFESIRPLRKAHSIIRKRYFAIQETDIRDPFFDFDFELVIIPDDEQILVLLYTEQEAFQEYWESLQEVSYYGYWNNADPDENVSDDEWTQRLKDWLRLLPYGQTPKDVGFCISLIKGVPSLIDIPKEKIIAGIPSMKKRINRIALDVAFDEKCEELQLKGEENAPIKVQRWLTSEEGFVFLDTVKKRIQKKLIPEIKKEHLNTYYKDIYQTYGTLSKETK